MNLIKLRLALETAGVNAGKSQGTPPSTLPINADEFGQFTIAEAQPEPFIIVAIGKVGMNAAIWVSDPTPTSRKGVIKMDHPALACFDPKAAF